MEYIIQTLLDLIKCKEVPDELKIRALTSLVHLRKHTKIKSKHKELIVLTLLDIVRGKLSGPVFKESFTVLSLYYNSLPENLQERIILRTRELLPRITHKESLRELIELLITGKRFIPEDQVISLITYFTELVKNEDDLSVKTVSIRALGRYSMLVPDTNVQAIAQTLLDTFETCKQHQIKRVIALTLADMRKRLEHQTIQRILTMLFEEIPNKNLPSHYIIDLSIVFRSLFKQAPLSTQRNMIPSIIQVIKTINLDLVKANLIGSLGHLRDGVEEDTILAIIQFFIEIMKTDMNPKIHYEVTKAISELFSYLTPTPSQLIIQDILEEVSPEEPNNVLKNISELFRKANARISLNLRLQILDFYEKCFEHVTDTYLLEDLLLSYGEVLMEIPQEPKVERLTKLKNLKTKLSDEWLLLVINSLSLKAQEESISLEELTEIIDGLLDQFNKNSNPLIRVRALRLLLTFKNSFNFELREKILQTLELRSTTEDNKIVLPEIHEALASLEG